MYIAVVFFVWRDWIRVRLAWQTPGPVRKRNRGVFVNREPVLPPVSAVTAAKEPVDGEGGFGSRLELGGFSWTAAKERAKDG